MADFETGAELTLSVNQSSLSSARDTIESELGDLEVGVDAVVQGNGGRMQPRDPSSGQFMAIEGVEQRVVNTNEVLDSVVQIETERWELDKVRNNYLEQIAERGVGSGAAGGGGLLGGARAAAAGVGGGGIAAALGGGAGLLGAFAANERFGEFSTPEALGRAAVQSGGNPAAFAGQVGAQVGRSIGLGEEAQNLIEGFGTGLEWPAPPNLAAETEWPELPDLGMQSWPDIPNLSTQTSWPDLPDFSTQIQWPDPPEFDFGLFGGDGPGELGRPRTGMQQGMPAVEPNINLGGITVDVTTTIDDAIDDAVSDVEDAVDREVQDLERRVSDAIGGVF